MAKPPCGLRLRIEGTHSGHLRSSVGSTGCHVLWRVSSLLKRCQTPDHCGASPVACERVAMSPDAADSALRFGRLEISPAERVLRVDGHPAALGARAFDLLLALAQRRDRLVTRQELLDLVWPGVVVEEHNITTQISNLRKILGPHMIATVPGHGYRLTAPLDEGTPVSEGALAHASKATRAAAGAVDPASLWTQPTL